MTDTVLSTKWWATCGNIGYMFAPGTMASILIGIPSACILRLLLHFYLPVGLFVLFAGTLGGVAIVARALRYFPLSGPDPSCIVLDEVVGMWWAMCCMPLTLKGVAWACLLFRMCDIVKPWPVSAAERLPGAWGIVGDDVVAGIMAMMILKALQWMHFITL